MHSMLDYYLANYSLLSLVFSTPKFLASLRAKSSIVIGSRPQIFRTTSGQTGGGLPRGIFPSADV